MKIFINPRFLKKLDQFKRKMKPFMVVELENQLAQIEEYPGLFSQLGNTKFYRREIKTDYFAFHIAYEWDNEKDQLIYWDIDVV